LSNSSVSSVFFGIFVVDNAVTNPGILESGGTTHTHTHTHTHTYIYIYIYIYIYKF